MSAFAELPARLFQGIVPAEMATCDAKGTPNITYLSQVFRVDDRHVALSCQFFNKTKQNVLENPYACVVILDPVDFRAWRLELRFLRAETSGPLFDGMAARIQAIASHTGMSGVFRLLSSDVYEVLACEPIEGFLDDAVPALPIEPPNPAAPRNEIRGLHLVSQATCCAECLDDLLSKVLETLGSAFGFEHAMVLLPDETREKLVAIASRGYGESGVGAEVRVGEGLIGTVARTRRLLRVSGVDVELRYGRAVRAQVEQSGARRELRPEIPLAGLPDVQSQMAIPLVAAGELVGVLAVESRKRLDFDEWDEAFLEIVANQVAVGIDAMMLRDADDEPATPAPPAPPSAPAPGKTRRFKFFHSDDCVFADDEYLVRNVPGRILWKLLRTHATTGRTEFSNRELRLDTALGLPAIRDNLESRLVLLRKRLAEKCPEVALVPTSRGHFRLEMGCRAVLEEVAKG